MNAPSGRLSRIVRGWLTFPAIARTSPIHPPAWCSGRSALSLAALGLLTLVTTVPLALGITGAFDGASTGPTPGSFLDAICLRAPDHLSARGMLGMDGRALLATLALPSLLAMIRRMRTEVGWEDAAREAAEATAREFEALVHGIEGIVWRAEAKTWAFDFVSEQSERILGYPARRWLEDGAAFFISLIHPADRDRTLRTCLDATAAGQTHRMEFRMITAEGRIIWVRELVRVNLDESGEPRTSYGLIVDITESKRAEQALRDREEQHRIALDAAGMGTWEYDRMTRRIVADERARRLFGFRAGEYLTLDTIEQRIHEEDRPAVHRQLQAAAAPGTDGHYDIEYRVIPRPGETRWVREVGQNLFRAWDNHREVDRAVGIVTDTTRQRRQAEAMRESERRFRSIFEAVQDPVFLWQIGPEAQPVRILEANEAACRIYGYSQPELRTIDLEKLVGSGYRAEQFHACLDRIRRERSVLAESEHRTRDGRWIPVEVRTQLLELGGREKLLSVVRDISERKRVERELRRFNEELERRVADRTVEAEQRAEQLRVLAAELTQAEQRERRRLARILHDDLQQLLVGIKMQLGLLSCRAESAGQIVDLVDEAIGSARSLSHELAPQVLYELGLGPGLQWLGEWSEEKHGLTVHVRSEEDAEPASEDVKVLLFQAVRELLLNVVKHAGVREAWVSLHREEGRLTLLVEDRGRGFEIEETASGAHGIGLFSLSERLQLIGGEVDIDAAPGRGTRVRIRAPLRPDAGEEASPAPEARPGARPPDSEPGETTPADNPPAGSPSRLALNRVLLVDDHKIVREGLGSLLRQQPDIEIVGEAVDGEQALDLARDRRPDTVIMDVSLPGISGVEATRRLMRERSGLRIIGLSMHEAGEVATAMRRAGAVAHLSKGAPAEQLLRAIRQAGRGNGDPDGDEPH